MKEFPKFNKINTFFAEEHGVEVLFLLILSLGALLRFYHIGTNSLWFDEVCTVTFDSFRSWLSNPDYLRWNMPLYFIVTDFVTHFSNNEVYLRLPGVIFGVIAIIYVYKIGRFCFNKQVALFSSLIISTSSFQIYYSQEARPYSLLMLLGVASTYYMIRALKGTHWKWWTNYVIFAALGLYTHLFMVFLLLVQNLFLLWSWHRKKCISLKIWLFPQVVIFLLFLPILIKFGNYYANIFQGASEIFQASIHNTYTVAPTFDTLVNILTKFFSSYFDLNFLFSSIQLNTQVTRIIAFIAAYPVRMFFLLLIMIGLLQRWYRKEDHTYYILFFGYLTVPLALMYLLSYHIRILNLRWGSFTYPAFCILIALSIDAFRSKRVKIILLTGIICANLVSLANIYYNPHYQKEQWRDVANHIQQNEKSADLIIFNADYVQTAFDYYYNGNTAKAGFNVDLKINEDTAWHRLQVAARGHNRIWLILSHDSSLGKVYAQTLSKHWQCVEEKQFKGIQVYRYTNDMQGKDSN